MDGWGGRSRERMHAQEDTRDGTIVAAKFVKRSTRYQDGVALGAIAELRALQELRHRYVIRLRDVFPSKDTLCLVLDYCLGDLEHVLWNPSVSLREGDVKAWALQLFTALAYMASRGWIHGVRFEGRGGVVGGLVAMVVANSHSPHVCRI
jgi:serine/threonine protein kinase